MIVEQIHEVRNKLEQRERLRNSQVEISSIKDTQVNLSKLLSQLKKFTSSVYAIKHVLNESEIEALLSAVSDIHEEILKQRESFKSSEKLQHTKKLQDFTSRVEGWQRDLQVIWEKYVNEGTASLVSLVEIVSPFISAEERNNIQNLQNQFHAWHQLPKDTHDVAKFNQLLAHFKHKIELVLPNFPEDVQQFLSKVNNQTADLTDLTPEILEWCHQKNTAQMFNITLKRGSSL